MVCYLAQECRDSGSPSFRAYPRRRHIPGTTDVFLSHPLYPLAGLPARVQAASISFPPCDLPNI